MICSTCKGTGFININCPEDRDNCVLFHQDKCSKCKYGVVADND